jgi:hypothetical protein
MISDEALMLEFQRGSREAFEELFAGPSLLIWAAVLFFPVRWLWKRLKKAYATRRRGDTEEETAG